MSLIVRLIFSLKVSFITYIQSYLNNNLSWTGKFSYNPEYTVWKGGKTMDLKMNYDNLKIVYQNLGADNFFKMFDDLFSNLKLYTMSTDWINSKEYILKFKGGEGDIIIGWN